MPISTAARPTASAVLFGCVDLLSAVLVYAGVFAGLPARYLPVDLAAGLVIALLAGAGLGLFIGAPRARLLARVAAGVTLALGLLLFALLALSASYVRGIYGPVGRGAALIMTLVAALALPYLVVLPAVQLIWLGARRKAGAALPGAQRGAS